MLCDDEVPNEDEGLLYLYESMRVKILVVLASWAYVMLKSTLIIYTWVGFNSKTHFSLSDLRDLKVNFDCLEKRNLMQ